MVDTRKLKTFIKLGDLDGDDIIAFTNEGKIVEKDFSKAQDGSDIKAALVMKASLNGEEPKELTLNNTTINILKQSWGSDSANWVGRKAKVTVVETLSFGQLKEVNVLKPIADEPPPAPVVAVDPAEEGADVTVATKPIPEGYCKCPQDSQKAAADGVTCMNCELPISAWDE